MYFVVKSKVKYNNNVKVMTSLDAHKVYTECLSPFLFSMFVNDLDTIT